ncbi:hypothetical protein BC827DRAFT_199406 [Russula dissimulans]|nr:hypothetical protein BC827DRAFT_199406 [Russula dissimulans]
MGRRKKGREAPLTNRGVLERRCRLDGRGSDQIGVWALRIARSELNGCRRSPRMQARLAKLTDPKAQARKQKNMYPIFIISSSPTLLITLYNVQHFPQESISEPSAKACARAATEGTTQGLVEVCEKKWPCPTYDYHGLPHTACRCCTRSVT